MVKEKYSYKGPVMMGDKFLGQFQGQTYASSEAEARKNLTYQCKKKCNQMANSNIKLAGKITKN